MPIHRIFAVLLLLVPLVTWAADATEQRADTVPERALDLPEVPFQYEPDSLPDHIASVAKQFDNTPADNPITNHGATLGRVLFYDVNLSLSANTSCATCHEQRYAFADNRRASMGYAGKPLRRNSMGLTNARYYKPGKFFWDERADTLEEQVLMPIEDRVEMGHNLIELIPELQVDPIYPPLFKKAFGDSEVTAERISRSLAQFVRSIVSYQSPYDIGRAQVASVADPFPNFTDEENLGKQQFFGHGRCAQCHLPDDESLAESDRQSAFFYLALPSVNGIDRWGETDDPGMNEVSGERSDFGRFKPSSLRNIELTAPYMHDGRFATLDAVIEHYNWSVAPHENLDPRLADFAADGMAMPEVQKVALAAFLRTLTDRELTKDPKFSDPFK